MGTSIRSLAAAGAAIMLMAACGGGAGGASSVDLAKVKAAAEQIYPAGGFSCAHGAQTFASCPFTSRLRSRLQSVDIHADLVCRCQNSYTTATIVAANVGGKGVAHATLSFGSGTTSLDWVFVQQGGAYLADDQYCTTGGPTTSLYTYIAPCP